MDYQRIYNQLMESRKHRKINKSVYYEKHHIVPRSMGGNDDSENIVKLTAREHFIAHWLLWRIHKNHAMGRAFYLMSAGISNNENRKIFSSIAYEEAKEAKSLAVSELNKKIKKGHIKSKETLEKLSKSLTGKKKTEDHKRKISESNKGKTKTDEHKNKLSLANTGFDWSSYTDRNKKISEANTGANNGRSRKVVMISEDGNEENVFGTMKDALDYLNLSNNVSKTTFYRKVKSEELFLGKYWKFLN